MRQTVVSWVLSEYGRVYKVPEERSGGQVGEIGAESLSIAGSTLAERRIVVLSLVQPGVKACAQKGHRIRCVSEEQEKCVFHYQGAKYSARLIARPGYSFSFQLSCK